MYGFAVLSQGAPILLLCLARRELIENHPEWSAPQPDRTLVELESLSDARIGGGEPAAAEADFVGRDRQRRSDP